MKVLNPSNKILPSYVTTDFTRGSVATYHRAGVLYSSPVNVPRFGDTGLILEGSATNNAKKSESFVASDWSITNAVISQTFTGPNGVTNAASSFTENSEASALQHTLQLLNQTLTSGSPYCFSIYVKQNSGTRNVRIQPGSGTYFNTNASHIVFDFSSKTIIQIGSSVIKYGSEELSNGWFRLWVSSNAIANSSNANIGTVVALANGTSIDYQGNGTSGIIVFGAQYVAGTKPGSYIATAGAVGTRSADVINNTNTALIWTNATNPIATYNSGTTYSIGQQVTYNFVVYESLQNSNLNRTPDINPTWWLSLGAENRVAAFDGKTNTATSASQNLKFIVTGGLNGLTILNIDADIIRVSAIDVNTKEVAYFNELGLNNASIYNWYDYFYIDPVSSEPITQLAISNIPYTSTSDYVFSIELSKDTTASVGSIIPGDVTAIGLTQYGAKASIIDYSKKTTDEFGNASITERPFSKRLDCTVFIDNARLNTVQKLLYSIRAKPVVWIASDDTTFAELAIVYGFYRGFSTDISYPDSSLCNLEIEGLI